MCCFITENLDRQDIKEKSEDDKKTNRHFLILSYDFLAFSTKKCVSQIRSI